MRFRQSFLVSSFPYLLVRRLIQNPRAVGRSNDASRCFQHFLRRLFFSRRKFQNAQNIPNFYHHPLFLNRSVELMHLQQLLNNAIHGVGFPKMQPLKTFTMSPHVIKDLRKIFVMLSQSGKDFGLLMSCKSGHFIKMHFSPANGTDEFYLSLEIFHENCGMTFRYHGIPLKNCVNFTQNAEIIEIQLCCKSNHCFQLFYTGKIQIPCFMPSRRTIGWINDFEIGTVTFYEATATIRRSVRIKPSGQWVPSRKRKRSQNASGMNKKFRCNQSLFEEMNTMCNHNSISKSMEGICIAPHA